MMNFLFLERNPVFRTALPAAKCCIHLATVRKVLVNLYKLYVDRPAFPGNLTYNKCRYKNV